MADTGTGKTLRIAAVSDIHYSKSAQGSFAPVFEQVSEVADVLLLPGDLTDFGLVDEARVLAKDLAVVKVPIVAVLGNHDCEANQERDITSALIDVGVHVLDGDTWEMHGVGFAGIRGFCGGFGRGALGPWGEKVIKDFVHEAVQEALKLEAALARLTTRHRVVLMHYAPVRETVVGEPPEIYPFLGSSRLEEPLTRFEVSAVFHGHAHKGSPEGATTTGIPVFNVSYALLKTAYPDRPPFRLFELSLAAEPAAPAERRQYGRRAGDRVSG